MLFAEAPGAQVPRLERVRTIGCFMGEIRVAARIGRYVIACGILAGITMDADEAQYVALFRLVD